ncbi:YybS family protein [Clostridium sp. MSJ-11]|uniref:YybS family protein n=1 Tax=Clostridium mobile TaxID=2841512 RepID=A0ABS6ENP1_9CLOT|nr:YybS family protein [Clostridium mobile]MBU5486382.1 YybS family protein [Clostridium mobile]
MQNRIYNTKGTVEAGVMTGLLVILALMNIYLPVFSIIGRFILPIPVVVLLLRHNLKVTITSVVASGILVGFIYNPLSGLTSAVMFGITGISLGYCIKKDKDVSVSIFALAISSLIGTIIDFVVYISLISKSTVVGLIDEMVKIMNESFQSVLNMYSQMGISEEQLKPLTDSLKLFNTDFIIKVLPGLLIMSSIIFAYFTYNITRAILRRLNYDIKEMPKFTHIHVNIKIATIVAIGLLTGIILVRQNIKIGEYILNSSQLILQYIFLFNGLSVAIYYLRIKYKLSKIMTLLIIMFTLFSPFAMVYVMLGISDIIIDFRKIDKNRIVDNK